MNDATEYRPWNGAILAEIGTLAAYGHHSISADTAAMITWGLGAFVVGVYVINSARDVLSKKTDVNKIYDHLING